MKNNLREKGITKIEELLEKRPDILELIKLVKDNPELSKLAINMLSGGISK